MSDELVNVRHFGFSKIEWKIKHFFAATCMEKWVIPSPVFTINGNNCTRWRLFLKINYVDEKYIICAYLLKKKCDSLEEPIWVTWNLYLCDVSTTSLEVEYDFESKRSVAIEICGGDILENIMQCNAEDTLIVRSLILVCSKESKIYPRSKDLGLKSLSQDLRVLYRVGRNYDLKLLLSRFTADAHKEILCCRNNVLKEAIEREHIITKLPELDIDAAKNVFGYLYTGNLDYVLRKPSLTILQCIQYFGIKELEEYYKPDELEICSEYQTEENKFDFIIPVLKIVESKFMINSSCIQKDSQFVFNLHLHPECATGESDFLSMFIEIIEKELSKTSYIEVAVIDSKGKCQRLQRRRYSYSTAKIGFDKFLPKDILKDVAFVCDGNIHLLCNFYTPVENSVTLSSVRNKKNCNLCIDPERHYTMLSDQMATMFETGIYSDFTLTCNEERFKVHTYILCARSHIFKYFFEKREIWESMESLDVSFMKVNVLRAVLYYMYSGRLLEHNIDEILEIYDVSERFYILPLKYACSSILQDNVESLNAKDALNLAQKLKDYKLIASLQNVIRRKTSTEVQITSEVEIEK